MEEQQRAEERKRVEELKGYGVLDTPNEAEFDEIVQEAAAILGTPVALISLVDENRQWFKARYGLEAEETPRSISFCTHALRGSDPLVVTDASKHDQFQNNPLVTGDPSIRFYAGAPLKTPTGRRIGTLCIIDNTPRAELTEVQAAKLEELAAETMRRFEARKQRKSQAAAA